MDMSAKILLVLLISSNLLYSQSQWQQLNSGTNAYLRDLEFISENVGWVVGHGGVILKTANGGINWVQQNSNTSIDLYTVSFIDDQHGWVGGYNGILLKTTNGGDTWQTGNISIDNVYGLVFIDESIGCAATGKLVPYYYGHIMRTTNGGNFWGVAYGPIIDDAFLDLFNLNTSVWAVGTSVTARSTNNGQSWYLVYPPTLQWLYDVFFFDNTTGWAVGGGADSEIILKTANGGISWQIQRESYQYQRLQGVCFTDLQNGWTVGENGIILKTTNGGIDWIQYNSPTTNYLREIVFPEQNIGYIVGENGTILKYSDNSNYINVLDPNGGEIITTGSSYYILWSSQNIIDVKIEYSVDNGLNWTVVVDSLPSTGIYDWTVPDSLTSQGRVKISDLSDPDIFDISDGTFTIQSSKSITIEQPNGGEIIDGGSTYEIIWSSTDVEFIRIEYSINNGASWNEIIENIPSTGIYYWNVPNLLSIQGRVKISDIATPSIYDVSDEVFRINYIVDVNDPNVLLNYNLSQNFPNPFNPSTRINYTIPEFTHIEISIYDVLGTKVTTLISEDKFAGNYSVDFDAINIPSGLYFYKLITPEFTATKKMILLK